MNYMNSVNVNVLLIILNVFCTSNHKTVQNVAAKSVLASKICFSLQLILAKNYPLRQKETTWPTCDMTTHKVVRVNSSSAMVVFMQKTQ